MIITVPFLAAVALAGVGALIAQLILKRFPVLVPYLPQPLIGGLLLAVIFWGLQAFHIQVQLPVKGDSVDFLVALLTTNMGLHVTGQVFRRGLPIFFLFLGFGVLLFFLQVLVNLPVAAPSPHLLPSALVSGPLSFVGAPFNLNPPDQVGPIAALFPLFPNLETTAQGIMMIGVLSAIGFSGLLGRYLLHKIDTPPPQASFDESRRKIFLTRFSDQLTALLVLTLTLIALSFFFQQLLLQYFSFLQKDHVPVIVISYLLGASVRLLYPHLSFRPSFPEQALTVLLIGPTMNLVLTYAVMSIPLHLITHLTLYQLIGGLLSVGASLVVSLLFFPVLRRVIHPYYAVVIATAFFALCTGWGPVAMSHLRRFVHSEGDVEPMPFIMPLNAFYLFPWMVILLIKLLL